MKRISSIGIWLFCWTCLLHPSADAQQHNFKQWSVQDGLPQSGIYSILQDSHGYLWIGTNGGGLARFDGKHFVVWNDLEEIGGVVIRSLLEDSRGNIWIGSEGGLTRYDGYTFRLFSEKDSLKGSSITCLAEDPKGRIWAGTDDGGINCLALSENGQVTISHINREQGGLTKDAVFDLHFNRNGDLFAAILFGGINIIHHAEPGLSNYNITYLQEGSQLPTNQILCMEEDGRGNVWVGTLNNGAFRITPDKDGEHWNVFTYPQIPAITGNVIWDIKRTSGGDVWFATGNMGAARLLNHSGDTINIRNFAVYDTSAGLPTNEIYRLHEDEDGNMWIGSIAGLMQFRGDHFIHYQTRHGLPGPDITGIDQDKDGNYWIVTDGGGMGIHNFVGNKVVARTMTAKDGLPSDQLRCISIGKSPHNPYVWIGTEDRGIVRFDGKTFTSFTEEEGLINDYVFSILVDKDGIVWSGTAGGISLFDGTKFLELPTDSLMMDQEGIKAIAEGDGNVIWFGTAGGLARYSKGDSTLRTFDEVEGLRHKNVNALTLDHHGNLYIGTSTGGIYRFNIDKPDDAAIEHIADDQLLRSNFINSLSFLEKDVLIAGTSHGFDKIFLDSDGNIKQVKNYDASDGFISVECNRNALYRDDSGTLWFGTTTGLTRYNALVEKPVHQAPKVHITGIDLLDEKVQWDKVAGSVTPYFGLPEKLELPFDRNSLTFHFSAISLNNPDKVRYSFILEGQRGAKWSPPTTKTEETFRDIAPGNYTFKVKAMNADGTWNKEPTMFRFITIHPPWYKTTWFYTVCVLFLVLSVFVFIKLRERKLKEEKRILEKTVAERTKEVVEQKEIIEEKNRDIMDSITYAKRIQTAVLPPDKSIAETLGDAFIFYKPKDIVSGDFYWILGDDQWVYYAAVDCTGHGVPGAFVSIVGYNGLNRTIREFKLKEPGKILDKLTEVVEENLRQKETEVKDGMDIALCVLDRKKTVLHFAGANNPLYFVREKGRGLPGFEVDQEGETHDLYEIKGDRQPIGKFDNRTDFVSHRFELLPGDVIYTFSDGFPDQFGGPKGKKFKYRTFKELLLSLQAMPMPEQSAALEKTIDDWMATPGPDGKTHAQIDDICIIGVRI